VALTLYAYAAIATIYAACCVVVVTRAPCAQAHDRGTMHVSLAYQACAHVTRKVYRYSSRELQ